MKKTLDEIRSEVAAVSANAQKLCAGLTEEQLSWRPQPGKWSIAENLAHLNVTTQLYVPHIQRAVERARQRALNGSGAFPDLPHPEVAGYRVGVLALAAQHHPQ